MAFSSDILFVILISLNNIFFKDTSLKSTVVTHCKPLKSQLVNGKNSCAVGADVVSTITVKYYLKTSLDSNRSIHFAIDSHYGRTIKSFV